jgi:hypothetical protein
MNPKQYAEELVDKMYNTEHCGIEHFPNKRYCDCTEMSLYQAKQCALIAVKHMKGIFDGLHKPEYFAFDAIGERKFTFEGEHPDHMTGYDMLEYLEQVEQEIQKL